MGAFYIPEDAEAQFEEHGYFVVRNLISAAMGWRVLIQDRFVES